MDAWGESALKISKKFLSGGIRGGSFDAEEVVDLTDKDDECNARCEAADDGRGDEGDEATEAQETDEEQECAREETCDPDTFEAVTLDEHDEHRGHGACGSADLERRACERAHDEACENGSDQPSRSGRTRSDPERERKRKRDRSNGETCQQVLLKFGKRIA